MAATFRAVDPADTARASFAYHPRGFTYSVALPLSEAVDGSYGVAVYGVAVYDASGTSDTLTVSDPAIVLGLRRLPFLEEV